LQWQLIALLQDESDKQGNKLVTAPTVSGTHQIFRGQNNKIHVNISQDRNSEKLTFLIIIILFVKG